MVSRFLGHSSLAISERVYVHLDAEGSMERLRDALR
jgi:integrase